MLNLDQLRRALFYTWVGVCFWGFLLTATAYVVKPAVAMVQPDLPTQTRLTIDRQTAGDSKAEQAGSLPTTISFPSLGNHSVNIEGGIYNRQNKSWTLTKTSAHYALITDLPSTKPGNTFIYGHNTPEIFGRLPELQTGAPMQLRTEGGTTHTYSLVTQSEVAPTDLSAFEFKRQPIVTVQTCSGIWNEKRMMFTFILEEAS